MARGDNTRVKHRLERGTHTRVDRAEAVKVAREAEDGASVEELSQRLRKAGAVEKFGRGEEFQPTDREKEQNEGRLRRTTKHFVMPGIPGTHDDEE